MTNIAGERFLLSKVGFTHDRLREEWGARFDYSNDRPVNIADHIFLHIAVVDDPGDLEGTEDQVMRNIERIGIQRFPNTGYSYNTAVFNTGRTYEGQPLTRRGAHTANDRKRAICSQPGCPNIGTSLVAPAWNNNVNGRAIVLPQNVGQKATDVQVDRMGQVGAAYRLAGFARMNAVLHGHRCVSPKDCPAQVGWNIIGQLKKAIDHYTNVGLKRGPVLTPQEVEEMFLLRNTQAGFALLGGFGLVYLGNMSTVRAFQNAGVKTLEISDRADWDRIVKAGKP